MDKKEAEARPVMGTIFLVEILLMTGSKRPLSAVKGQCFLKVNSSKVDLFGSKLDREHLLISTFITTWVIIFRPLSEPQKKLHRWSQNIGINHAS